MFEEIKEQWGSEKVREHPLGEESEGPYCKTL
jgi:hypothetical protein